MAHRTGKSLRQSPSGQAFPPSTISAVTALDMLRVLTRSEAAQLAGMSEATLKRLINTGDGPRCVQLSTRRCGIVPQDFKAWLDSRPPTINVA
jgi:predicted DNA-binding transcriptional regulator AlpA